MLTFGLVVASGGVSAKAESAETRNFILAKSMRKLNIASRKSKLGINLLVFSTQLKSISQIEILSAGRDKIKKCIKLFETHLVNVFYMILQELFSCYCYCRAGILERSGKTNSRKQSSQEKTNVRRRYLIWLVVSTNLKNIGQIGNLPQVGVKIKNI